ALENEAQRGRAVNERAAEIAVRRAGEEGPVLHPHRAVEAERRDRLLALALVGLRVDQDVGGIADRVHANEDQQRHDEQDQHGLHAAADDENGHGPIVPNGGTANFHYTIATSCPWSTTSPACAAS